MTFVSHFIIFPQPVSLQPILIFSVIRFRNEKASFRDAQLFLRCLVEINFIDYVFTSIIDDIWKLEFLQIVYLL